MAPSYVFVDYEALKAPSETPQKVVKIFCEFCRIIEHNCVFVRLFVVINL